MLLIVTGGSIYQGQTCSPSEVTFIGFRVVTVKKKSSDIESDDNSNDNDWTYSRDRKGLCAVAEL